MTFEVEIGQSPYTIERLSCQEEQGIRFETNHLDETKIPMLIVYSYEELAMEENGTLISEVLLQQLRNSSASRDQSLQSRRRKRSTLNQVCGIHDLNIDTSHISSRLIGAYSTVEISTPSIYNAHICGGFCHSAIPHHKSPMHTTFLSILRLQENLENTHNYGQCCGPITFEPLGVFGFFDNIPMVKSIDDMIVTACGCTDVVV